MHEDNEKRRGNACTKKYTGEHPKIMQENMDKLIKKFNKQLNENEKHYKVSA